MRKYSQIFFYFLTIAFILSVVCFGSRSVTTLSENQPIERDTCIIIDAGHGGVDGGATSCSGKLESAYNLEIAVRLNDLFQLLGRHTQMIRDKDISVYTEGETIAQKKISDLKERVRIVNDTENALLLSIHQNYFTDSRYSGGQVFYANTSGSRELAIQLQQQIVSSLNPESRRQCKKGSGIYLMEHIDCTGVLVECGFLSNPEEDTKLRNISYQQKLCCVIAAAVSQYLSNA